MLTLHVPPQLGDERVVDVSKKRVADWYRVTCSGRPRQRAKVYALLKTIMNPAVEDGLIVENPVALSTAERQAKSSASKQRRIEPATLDQLATIAGEMPERLRLAALLAAWGALRYGEVVELRRRDLDLGKGIVHVRRAVTTGAVMPAETGATLAELMARLGHTSVRMAIRHQHAALNADQRIAEKHNLLASRAKGARLENRDANPA
jgi:hypothetical protein